MLTRKERQRLRFAVEVCGPKGWEQHSVHMTRPEARQEIERLTNPSLGGVLGTGSVRLAFPIMRGVK